MIEVLLCELSVLDLSIRPENRLPYLNFSNDNSLGTFIYLFIFIIIIFCYFTILYWFCHTSTCIHHGYTRVPHPEPPPISLPVPSLWVVSVHQPQASCILHRTWTGDSFHIWYYTCFNAITCRLLTEQLWGRAWESIYNQFFSVPSDILKITESKDLNSSSNGDFKLLELKGEVVVMCVWGWLPW